MYIVIVAFSSNAKALESTVMVWEDFSGDGISEHCMSVPQNESYVLILDHESFCLKSKEFLAETHIEPAKLSSMQNEILTYNYLVSDCVKIEEEDLADTLCYAPERVVEMFLIVICNVETNPLLVFTQLEFKSKVTFANNLKPFST